MSIDAFCPLSPLTPAAQAETRAAVEVQATQWLIVAALVSYFHEPQLCSDES